MPTEAPQDGSSVNNPKSATAHFYLIIQGAAKLIEDDGTPLHKSMATRLVASFWEFVAANGLPID